jgi:hypothetical protein
MSARLSALAQYSASRPSAIRNVSVRIVFGALLAFGLAVGVGAHAFDELRGRPLGTHASPRQCWRHSE